MSKKYNETLLRQTIVLLVIIGALNWGCTAFGFNLVDMLHNQINKMFNSNVYIDKIIYTIIALAALQLIFDRNTWLPFLGDSVFPSVLIPVKNNNGDTVVKVQTRPNTKISYWSSMPSEKILNVEDAYGDYSNSGVVFSDQNGTASLIIKEGTSYIVPSGREIPRHIHYREIKEDGMMDPIKTVYY